MANKVCSNCKIWRYDRFTEEYLGMGVGRCGLDNSPQFCDHPCPFCDCIEENDDECI